MSHITVSQIVAIAANSRAIGKDNKLLWHVPEDLQHFKHTTLGKPIIMGRKTYDSVGFPLPGRTNIVVSRDKTLNIDGVLLVASCEEALAVGKQCCEDQGIAELMVAGGAEIYRQTLAHTDKIYLSEIDVSVEGDTFYPELLSSQWHLESEDVISTSNSTPEFRLKILMRR